MNVGFISLGCSKNLIDTEMMIGLFKNNNFTIVNDPKIADIIVINMQKKKATLERYLKKYLTK